MLAGALKKAGKEAPKEVEDPFAGFELTDRLSAEPPKEEGFIQNSGIETDGNAVLVPVMTEDDNANNVAPTGKRMARISTPNGVGIDVFRRALGNAYAQYRLTGAYTPEHISESCGISTAKAATIVGSPEFRTAMRARGAYTDSTGLTSEQDIALIVLTDPTDGRTLQQKLKSLGITFATFAAWKKQPTFAKYYNGTINEILNDNSDSLMVVEQLGLSGNLSAIQYKHLLNGFYNPKQQDNVDLMAFITTVFDVLSRHVKDGEVLKAIASDLKGVIERKPTNILEQ